MLTKYTDPIVTTYRYKPDGEKVTIPIEEKLEVTNGIVFLKEIPDKNLRVMIDGKIEVYKPEDLDSESKFYVDYNTGVIFVQKSLNGKKLSINYSGIGVTYYPASRIYLKVDENHSVTKTLADIEDQISNLNSLNSEQERLKREIEQRNQEISKTLEEVKKVDMTGAINEATQTKKALDDSIHNAKSTDATLKARIEFSEGVRVDLAKKNEQAQENIDSLGKANTESATKAQALNESIDKATKTDDSLKATESSITSSLSTYSTKSEELKGSISQIDSKNAELKSTIEKSNTADSKLKETTKIANESNENLKTTNQKATEINQSLKTENEKAEQTTTTLSSKIDSGLNVKIGLDDSIAKGKRTKTELDDSNAKATETNTTLKDSTEKAKKEKGDLTTIVTSGQEVAKELSERNQSANVNIEDLKRENKKAIDNTSGLQVETQNALTKQQTLSDKTTKANESIEVLKGLLASSANSEQALKEIIASGDLGKYVTDPKLAEVLTQYATKDDLEKIDVTSQLTEYAKRNDIPTSLSQLEEDEAHKVVTQEEKETWNKKLDENSDISNNMVTCDVYDYATSGANRGKIVKTEKFEYKLADTLSYQSEFIAYLMKAKQNAEYVATLDKNMKIPLNQLPDEALKDTTYDLSSYLTSKDLEGYKKADGTTVGVLTSEGNVDANTIREEWFFAHYGSPNTPDIRKGWYINTINFGKYLLQIAYDASIKKEVYLRSGTDYKNTKKYDWSSWKTITANFDLSDYAKREELDTKADKAEIPTKLSELENDKTFKTETEIQEMISKSSSFKKEVVDALPSSGEENVFYLVKDTNGKDNNNYLEYLRINGKWELIGSTDVDLSGYATKSEVESKAEKSDIPTKVSQLENDKNYVKKSSLNLRTLNGAWRNTSGDFNAMSFKQGLEFIIATNIGKRRFAKNFPDGLGKYFVYTNLNLTPEGEYLHGGGVQQLVFCLKNRKFYTRGGTIFSSDNNGLLCSWGELSEIESPTPDLSPFTQQELEEAFK